MLNMNCVLIATQRGNHKGWHPPCFRVCLITAGVRKMSPVSLWDQDCAGREPGSCPWHILLLPGLYCRQGAGKMA